MIELGITFNDMVQIEPYSSHHLDAMRGISDVSFVQLDEASSWPAATRNRCYRKVHRIYGLYQIHDYLYLVNKGYQGR